MLSVLGEKEAMIELGARIRAERLRRNLPQQHVAGIVGVSLPTYRKIEAGDGSVEFGAVARTLGVLGYVDALPSVVSDPEPEVSLRDLLKPQRKHAYPRCAG